MKCDTFPGEVDTSDTILYSYLDERTVAERMCHSISFDEWFRVHVLFTRKILHEDKSR